MTAETNDAWMKPSPRNPWPALGWRLLGCVMVTPLIWYSGRLVPEAAEPLMFQLPRALWLLSLVAFCYARFWRNPKPLWGRLVLAGPGWGRFALRVSVSLLVVAVGLPVYVLVLSVLLLPFSVGRWI